MDYTHNSEPDLEWLMWLIAMIIVTIYLFKG